jgi:hypothetical protein
MGATPVAELADADLLGEAISALESCACLYPDRCQGPALTPDLTNDCYRCTTLARIRPRIGQPADLERRPRTRVRMPSGRHIDTYDAMLRFDDARSSAREALQWGLDRGTALLDEIEDNDSFELWTVHYVESPGTPAETETLVPEPAGSLMSRDQHCWFEIGDDHCSYGIGHTVRVHLVNGRTYPAPFGGVA